MSKFDGAISILSILSLFGLTAINNTGRFQPIQDTVVVDTVVPVVYDTVLDVQGKKALFIGDSHTSGYGWGWQDIMCKKTKMTFLNTAVGGKRTSWMITKLEQQKKGGWDYCFIYGGANDCASMVTPETAFNNIQKMVDTCIAYNIKPIVITGTDPNVTFTGKAPEWKDYVWKKTKFQNYLVDSLKRAVVVDTRFIPRSDCADFVCHMKLSGHRKTADTVISTMNFLVH